MEWKSDYIKYDDNKIHFFYGNGNKKPVILLHGAMDNGLCFSPVAEKLSKDYRVIMPDARGHGLTETPEAKFSYDLMAQDIARLIKDLNLEGTQIMGHSMGAAMTTMVASNYPELVSRIILEDPAFRTKGMSKVKKGLFKFLAKIILPRLFKGTYEDLVKSCHKRSPTWSDEEVQPWAESKILFREKNPKILVGLLEDARDWKEIIKNISCPILLITSDKGITKDKMAQDMVNLSKDCKWVKIEGAGHNIRREQFEKYLEEVQDFLVP